MEGTASVASDVLASYAADAALEVDGVRGLVGKRMPRHGAVRIEEADGRAAVELHLELEWGASAEAGRPRGAAARGRLPGADGGCPSRGGERRRRRDRTSVKTRVTGLTGATLGQVAPVCHECIWWQSRTAGRSVDKTRWIEKAETEFGAWGTVYYDDDGRVLGSMQYGPAGLYPRAAELPAGPPSDDAVLVTCAYLIDRTSPWVLQSLFLAAIGEAKDRGAAALEAFAYRYGEGESDHERFLVHRTVFPHDFLADFGFQTVRAAGPVELARLELGGLVRVLESRRVRLWRRLKDAFLPEPVPAPRP